MRLKSYIATGLLAWGTIFTFAQVQNKIIVVETNYRPEVEQTEKLSVMPEFSDTTNVKPEINYSVLPSRLKTTYNIKPIKPAKLVGSPLDELYRSQIRLGLGNYTTPLAEFNINNLRSKEYSIGAYVFHRSSHTKLKLDDGNKVPAGYSRNKLSLYGKRFFKDVNVEGEVYLNTDKYRFYGYNTSVVQDTSLEAKDIRQYFTQVGAKAEVYSTKADSGEFQYRLGLDANYFGDDYENRENQIHLPGQVEFSVQSFQVKLNADYNLFAQKFNSEEQNKHVFLFNPQVKKRQELWEVMLGAKLFIINAEESKVYFYPEANLEFKVIDRVMNAYFGINGGVSVHNFSAITKTNPYIRPGLSVEDSRNKLTGYGGLKGQLSSNSGYLMDVSFSSLDNVHFFVNDTLSELENQFGVVYDKMERVQVKGELWYKPLSFLDFYLKGKHNTYSLTNEAEPWHVPAFTMSFTTRYNFKEKIFAGLDIIHIGKRYAKDMHNAGQSFTLDPVWDLNLNLEYKYSEVLSMFLEFHNLFAQQYYIWNQYPTQKLNLLAGFSYKF